MVQRGRRGSEGVRWHLSTSAEVNRIAEQLALGAARHRVGPSGHRTRLRRVSVVAQVALSLMDHRLYITTLASPPSSRLIRTSVLRPDSRPATHPAWSAERRPHQRAAIPTFIEHSTKPPVDSRPL
jgi:hypothetical protein